MKKLLRVMVAAVMASIIFTSTVFATPSVGQLKEDKKKAEEQLQKLETKMTNVMSQINKTENDLVEVGQAVIEATENLEKAEKKEAKQYDAMKRRIVAMYENGSSSMIQMILEADSFGEMLQQAENVNALHTYDRNQLQEYVKTKEKIESLKTSLEKDMASIEKKQKSLEEDKKELDSMISNMKTKVSDYESRIQRAVASAATSSSSNKNTGSTYVPPVGAGGGSDIVRAAYQYLGVPYVWGGTSSKGVDCSGLVMLAHRACGITLGRTSDVQGGGGKAVSASQAQPGDVVCYVGHVGIYIGGGKMVHAPRPGKVVQVVDVYGSPWYRRYW